MGLGAGPSWAQAPATGDQAGSALPALGAKGQRLKINSRAAFLGQGKRRRRWGQARLRALPPYLAQASERDLAQVPNPGSPAGTPNRCPSPCRSGSHPPRPLT